MKLFIPAVGYRIKLTSNWTFAVYYEDRNKTLLTIMGKNPRDLFTIWQDRFNDIEGSLRSDPYTLPVGTILEVDRVYVRTFNKVAATSAEDYDSITFKTLLGRNKIRFWAKLADVNNIEYELPEDFSAGKDNARANAKKPKKLKLQDIANIVTSAMNIPRPFASPSWYTSDVERGFGDMAREFEKRDRPLDLADLEKRRTEHEAQHRHAFNCGNLSIPVGLASIIKTYDDYKHHIPDYSRWVLHEWLYKPDYVIGRMILGSVNYDVKSVFSRDADKRCVRRFSKKTNAELGVYCHGPVSKADVTDFWIEVVTNENDTEIVEVRSGFTPT